MQKDEKKNKFDPHTPRHALHQDSIIYTVHNRIVITREQVLSVDQKVLYRHWNSQCSEIWRSSGKSPCTAAQAAVLLWHNHEDMSAATKYLGLSRVMGMTTSRNVLSTTVRTSWTSVHVERGPHRLNKARRMSELRVDGTASNTRHVKDQWVNQFSVVWPRLR